ncbi:MAG: RidA family protein [Woeseiaceae bacterium]|nr:RidA family protein [Woeseiaceae bacterium]
MTRQTVKTDKAPSAIGPYSQGVQAGNLVFLSGQIPLVPATMEMVDGDFERRTRQVFDNLRAVAEAAGGSMDQIVKLTIYLTDLGNFGTVNEIMTEYFSEPYPARAALGVAALPKNADIEAEAILAL